MQTYLRYLWATSLVPLDKVIDVWENFILDALPVCDDSEAEDDPDAAAGFDEAIKQAEVYFESTYIGSKVTRAGGQRKKPKFPHKVWNHYESILKGEDITTNLSEAWNSASKLSMPMKPNLWTLLDAFKREEAGARAKMLSISRNTHTDSNPGRTAKRRERRSQLVSVLEKFGSVPLEDYMNMVAAHYND